MGIKGLQYYLENHCPNACYTVNLAELAEQHKKETGLQPVLVVDGSSCMSKLYGQLSWLCGGQWIQYVRMLQDFVNAFRAIGFKLVIFFDGITEGHKRPVWAERRLRSLRDVYTIFDLIKSNQAHNIDDRLFQLPAGMGLFARFVFKHICGCEVYTSIRECDEELAEYVRRRNCFGILGQDTDYVIYNCGQYYFSMNSLNLQTMQTLNYDRYALTRMLRIKLAQLPLLASLLGNDIVPADDLVSFHRFLCNGPQQHAGGRRPQIVDVIYPLAQFLQSQPSGHGIYGALPSIAHTAFRDEQRASCLETSVRMYFMDPTNRKSSYEHVNVNAELQNPSVWERILRLAHHKHVNCEDVTYIYGILIGAPFESSTGLEDFRVEVHPSSVTYQLLRRRIYGILLHEKPPNSNQPLQVEEWCMHGENSLREAEVVQPEKVTVSHPGLLSLWSNDPLFNDARWLMLGWAVSPTLLAQQPQRLDAVRQLPSRLVAPALIVLYLYREIRPPVLEQWEVDVFIAMAIILPDWKPELERMTLPASPHAMHLATMYMRGVTAITFLNGAVGRPVPFPDVMPWMHFDGLLFHKLYRRVLSGEDPQTFTQYRPDLFNLSKLMRNIICA